jgi:hypothetical protein
MTFDPARGRGDGYSVPHTSGKVLTVLALVAVLAVGCIVLMNDSDSSEAASETSGSCGADLAWSYDSSTGALTVTGSGSMTDFSYSDTRWGGNDIKSVSLPDGLTSIGNNAFFGCTSLTSVTIPDSVTSIGNNAFRGCTSLSSVTIPDSVTSIENYAFSGCTSLTSVTIPDSVTSIGYDAFWGCTSLTSVTIPDSVTSIRGFAFSRCTSLTAINVAEGNTAYCSDNGALYDKSGNALHTCPAGIESFILPNTVKSVGDGAFSGGILREVTFTSGADVSIKHEGFYDCASLKKIIIEDSAKVVFGPNAIAYTDSDKHTVYVKAPEGFKMPGNALYGNVEIIYGEPPSGEFPILYAVIGIIAVLALIGGAVAVKKRRS